MNRSIPVWLLLFCLLLWALFTVFFGWSVKSTLAGNDRSGVFGEAAVEIAAFPTTVKDVAKELMGYASGDYKDQSIRIQREAHADYSGHTPLASASGIDVPGLFMKADREKMTKGWRVLAGAFHINGGIENAVLLISPELEVVRTWILDEIPVGDMDPRPKYQKFVHGVEVLPDGSVIFTFDGSVSLQKFDVCGEREWATAGNFHHAVTLDDTAETVWTFSDPRTIAQVSVKDGEIRRQISVDDIIKANPTIDILELPCIHANDLGVNSRNTEGHWRPDPHHFNDVDPLPRAIADRFVGFEAGDLLVSARNINLVFVLDPDTLEIKWWRTGAVQRLIRLGFVSRRFPDYVPQTTSSISISLPERN